MAVALLAIVTLAMRWRDLKFVAPKPMGSLRVLWSTALYLLVFALMPAVLGLPPASTLLFGAAHVVNVVTTGQLGEAIVQAAAALYLLRGVRNDTRLATD